MAATFRTYTATSSFMTSSKPICSLNVFHADAIERLTYPVGQEVSGFDRGLLQQAEEDASEAAVDFLAERNLEQGAATPGLDRSSRSCGRKPRTMKIGVIRELRDLAVSVVQRQCNSRDPKR